MYLKSFEINQFVKKKRKIFELNTKNYKQVDVLYGEEQYKIHY